MHLRQRHRRSIRAWPLACALLVALALSACDKCGDSIFRAEAGPQACKGEMPR